MARSIKIHDPFARAVETALEHCGDAVWLGTHSPLAAPYFLGSALNQRPDAESPAGRGSALQSLLQSAARSLSVEQQHLLTVSFFKRDWALNNTSIAMRLNMAETTYYRRRAAAIEALADAVNREAAPPWRCDMPRAQPLINRDALSAECLSLLRDNRTVALSGIGGMGKTALGAALAREMGDVFWFTIHPGLNDHLTTFVFALAHFLRERRASATWRQLVADRGVTDPAHTLGLLRYDLATVVSRFVMCVDDFDLLRDDTAQHAPLIHMLDALRSNAPLLLMGQQVLLDADRHVVLPGLNSEEAAQLLASRGMSVTPGEAEAARAHTRGNPALLTLLAGLGRDGESLRDLLRLLASAPSVEPLLHRTWQRISEEQRSLLMALSVFDGAAPRDAWSAPAAFAALIERDLVRADDSGGVSLPAYVRAFVQRRMPPDVARAAHRAAGQIMELRSEYTAAARYYLQADQPALAIWTWFNHRDLEIDRGHAPAARAMFAEVCDGDSLKPDDRRALSILRAELALRAGGADEAEAALARTTWPLALPATSLARQLQGDALEAQGRITQALEAYREAWRALDSAILARVVSLHVRIGYIHVNREPDLARAELHATLALWEAYRLVGYVQQESGRYQEAARAFETAHRLAEDLPNNKAKLALSKLALSALHMRTGRGEEAVSYARAALQLDEAVGDVVRMLFDKLNLSSALIVARKYEEALTCATTALVQAKTIHHTFLVCGLSVCSAESSFYLSRLADAEQHAECALSLEEEAFRPYALSVLGWVREAQGRYADACAWLAQAIESARQIGDRYAEAQALLALGRAQLSAGEDRAGRATLSEAAQAFSALNLPAEAECVHQLLGLSA